MPLDEFQKGIATVLSTCRDRGSPFAGGAVIHQHGFRLSKDQDIFTGWNTEDIARRDVAALEEAGYEVFLERSYDGFREYGVSRGEEGFTILQWAHGLGREFYEPVPDNQFGYRLHFADLATNKALAAATRMVMRDFIDLWMLDRHVLPLWRALCAAPGKDVDFNPLSLTERISFNWHVAKARDREGYEALIDISPEDVGPSLLDSLHEANLILGDMPAGQYGCLQVGKDRQPVLSRECGLDGDWTQPVPGGGLPSFEGADSEMIAGLIAEYGPEGSRFTMDGNDTDYRH